MNTLRFTLFFFILKFFKLSASEFIYTAIAPKVIRPHETYEVFISVESSQNSDQTPVSFEINVKHGTDNNYNSGRGVYGGGISYVAPKYYKDNSTIPTEPGPIVHQETKILPGSSNSVKLTFPELPEEFYNLTIKATTNGKDKPSEDFALLHVENKELGMLVQTDKTIYKPGEVVQFRVLFLDRLLRPANLKIFDATKSIDIKIIDSQRNTIKLWKNIEAPTTYGLIKKSIELSTQPNLGEWSIEVGVGQGQENSPKSVKQVQKFTIDEYVLPKFKVEAKPKPSFVTFNESKFILDISSTYTHGKPVKGECTVTLQTNTYELIEEIQPMVGSDGGDQPQQNQRYGPRIITKTVQMDGEAHIEFDLKTDLKILYEDAYDYGQEYKLQTSCTEQLSGKVQNSTGKVMLYKYPYKISAVDPPSNYKPGFPLTMTLKIATQDGIPISDSNTDALKIEHGFSYDVAGGVMTKPIPPTGLVTVTFTTPTNEYININNFDVTYKDLTQYISVPGKQTSPSKTYIQISIPTSPSEDGSAPAPFKIGDKVPITVRINKPFNDLHYILISRGNILLSQSVSFPTKALEQIINFQIPPKSSSSLNLIVYTVFSPKNEVIVDNLRLDVLVSSDKLLKISLTSPSTPGGTVEPGANITISCEGLPKSLIALRGVDQSVLLLKEDKDVTKSSLKGVEDSFDEGISNHRIYGGSDAFQIFDQIGVQILTNALINKNVYPINVYNDMPVAMASFGATTTMRFAAKMNVNAESNMQFDSDSNGGGSSPPQVLRIRKDFPETWIFSEIESLDGKATVDQTVPDTITSWIINGFQISPEEGIGLTDSPTKLVVFRPFFISLNLPYSIVQGEILSLQVMVHNYMSEIAISKITLDNSQNNLEFLEGNNKRESEMTKEVTINASSVAVTSFIIVASKIGTITLNVKGLTNSAGDAVSQPLIIRPPGTKHVRNHAAFINLINDRTQSFEISAIFPDKRVPDADSVKISVTGDILGGTINNLDSLIQLPQGCGEQNMLNFVPDIVVLDYLNATDALTLEIKKKTLNYLEQGYQRELTYKRYDGSFSCFGASDRVGSTWLTAFVVKSFISAKRFIWIDEMVVISALEFLNQQQSENGSFIEEGAIHHLGIQGGASTNKNALSAYILLAFVEAKTHLPSEKFNYNSIIDLGVKYLLKEFEATKFYKDIYTINLVTYLLHLIDHPKKDELFKSMEDRAKLEADGELKYWLVAGERSLKSDGLDGQIFPFYWNPWEPHVQPASVELTAYALMTYLIREKKNDKTESVILQKDSIAIARWLMKQRNENGGFLSTQDTVVGVTALALFSQSIKTPKDKYNLKIKTNWESKASGVNSHDFSIGKEDLTTLQEYILSESVRSVNVTAEGTGIALAQLSWTYYTLKQSNLSGFTLTVTNQGKDKNRRLEMSICAAYILDGKSNMAILEVNTPTGYYFDTEEITELKQANPQIMRHELEDRDTKLNIYFNHLESEQEICLKMNSFRMHLVAKHSKASVVIYDYYDTTRRTQKFYEAPEINVCNICKMDDSCEMKNCFKNYKSLTRE